MTTFNEALHDRDHSGRFTEMPGSAPEGILTPHSEVSWRDEARLLLEEMNRTPAPAVHAGRRSAVARYDMLADEAEAVLRARDDERARRIVDRYDRDARDARDARSPGDSRAARLDFAAATEAYLQDEAYPVLAVNGSCTAAEMTAAIQTTFPWANTAAAERIRAGRPDVSSAEPHDNWFDDYDQVEAGDVHCKHCDEPIANGLDGVPGRWGHAASDDVACHGRERRATDALAMAASGRMLGETNPITANRLRLRALEHINAGRSMTR